MCDIRDIDKQYITKVLLVRTKQLARSTSDRRLKWKGSK